MSNYSDHLKGFHKIKDAIEKNSILSITNIDSLSTAPPEVHMANTAPPLTTSPKVHSTNTTPQELPIEILLLTQSEMQQVHMLRCLML